MSGRKKKSTRSLRNVRSFYQVCQLSRDNASHGPWMIMTDGRVIWISRQETGHKPTHSIEIPKAVFDRLVDGYTRPLKIIRSQP